MKHRERDEEAQEETSLPFGVVLQVLVLLGCIRLTDAGVARLAGLHKSLMVSLQGG